MASELDNSEECTASKGSLKKGTRSVSPVEKCAICLCAPENRSFTDSCFHEFCFVCLVEWSKVKTECPLCKLKFKNIIHNIKSVSEFDELEVRHDEAAAPSGVSVDLNSASFGYDEWGNRFRYNSTMTAERMELIRHIRTLRSRLNDLRRHEQSDYRLRKEQERLQRLHHLYVRSANRPEAFTASLEFRRMVYERGMRVRPLDEGQMSSTDDSVYIVSYRDTSPEFYRENPAQMHRLLRWLARELNVFFDGRFERINFVSEFVCYLLTRYEIRSAEFRRRLGVILLDRTDHFLHEFYHFARAPFEMPEYDRRVTYAPHAAALSPPAVALFDQSDARSVPRALPLQAEPPGSSAASDSLAQLRSSVRRTRHRLNLLQCSVNQVARSVPLAAPSRPESVELISLQDHHVTPSSDSESHVTAVSSPSLASCSTSSTIRSLNVSPDRLGPALPRTATPRHTSPVLHSTPPSSTRTSDVLCASSSDEDDVQIVAELKPKNQRTPELLNVASSDEEDKPCCSKGRRRTKRRESRERRRKRHKKHSRSSGFESSSEEEQRRAVKSVVVDCRR